MGMFDDVRCLYPTPWPESATWEWQSKETSEQALDQYEIRADGTLWHEEYDARVEKDPKAPLGMWLHRDNPRWVQETDFTGQLEIHTRRHSIVFWFREGKVKEAVFYQAGVEVMAAVFPPF